MKAVQILIGLVLWVPFQGALWLIDCCVRADDWLKRIKR